MPSALIAFCSLNRIQNLVGAFLCNFLSMLSAAIVAGTLRVPKPHSSRHTPCAETTNTTSRISLAHACSFRQRTKRQVVSAPAKQGKIPIAQRRSYATLALSEAGKLMKRSKKQRIDILLVERGLAESREQAKRLILAGSVTVNDDSQIKPGHRVPEDAKVVVHASQKYVSRGGLKLEKALRLFNVDVQNRVALDVGASTGGFTDCLLQHGAGFVYAVDVGYGQLAWKLRTHPQVQTIEKTNIRLMSPKVFKHRISLAVIDVSFISLRSVLPVVVNLLTTQHEQPGRYVQSQGSKNLRRELQCRARCVLPSDYSARNDESPCCFDIIALMKPQFEAGRAHVKKGGVVPDKHVHIQTIDNLIAFATQKLGATVMGLTYSPIHWDIGNIEYLLWFHFVCNPALQGSIPGVMNCDTTNLPDNMKARGGLYVTPLCGEAYLNATFVSEVVDTAFSSFRHSLRRIEKAR